MIDRANMRMNIHRGQQRMAPSCNNGQTRADDRRNDNDGCGCGTDCKALLRKLQKIDFSIVDTVLYLDAYPECAKALAYYHKLLDERAAVREALAKRCKRPMSSFENASEDSWDWISSPWPWETFAN